MSVADDVNQALDEVRSLKASAKSARVDEDWRNALIDCTDAASILTEQLQVALPAWEAPLRSELADTYGLIGGIHKRWGLSLSGSQREAHLNESLRAYEQGYEEERDLPPSEASTYNRINRLIGRVLVDPAILQGPADRDDGGFFDDLRQAEEILAEQVNGSRQRDPWAFCDLVTIRLLLGREDVMVALHGLERLNPPPFVYDSWFTTLDPLTEATAGTRPALAATVNQIRRSLRLA